MHQKLAEIQQVPNAFGESAHFYHHHAKLQRHVAQRLAVFFDDQAEDLPPGPILELGCGTGFLSKELARLFPERPLIFSDRSARMVEACRQNIGFSANRNYKVMDATKVPVNEPSCAMTISSFVAQWFPHPALALARWLEVTKRGGLLLAAFPGNRSFPEWREQAESLSLPYTANKLPDTGEIADKISSMNAEVNHYEVAIVQSFHSAADFFRHIKSIGAAVQQSGRHLSAGEMRRLINHWDGQSPDGITVTWQVVYLAVKKPFG